MITLRLSAARRATTYDVVQVLTPVPRRRRMSSPQQQLTDAVLSHTILTAASCRRIPGHTTGTPRTVNRHRPIHRQLVVVFFWFEPTFKFINAF